MCVSNALQALVLAEVKSHASKRSRSRRYAKQQESVRVSRLVGVTVESDDDDDDDNVPTYGASLSRRSDRSSADENDQV